MKELLTTNIVMSGHIDHGKSTLIGRLLYDTDSINPRIREEIEQTAKEEGKEFEFSFFMDSLKEEREGGITIDITQTPFKSRNSYNIIDVPGHKEFIKNMVTGASQADAVILVVSAKPDEGVQEQTRRHMFLINFLGIKQVFVVVNKMDTVDYSEERFNKVKQDVTDLLESIGYDKKDVSIIPISAREGDNISRRSERIDWYSGPTLVESLDNKVIPLEKPINKPLRMPIQDIYDIDGDKILVGKVETGIIRVGDRIIFQPAGQEGQVERILVFNEEKREAWPGESIGIKVSDTEKIGRGNVCGSLDKPPNVSDRFAGQLFPLTDKDIQKGENLTIRCGTSEVAFHIENIERKIDSETGKDIKAELDTIKPNEAVVFRGKLSERIAVERFSDIPELGRFVAIKDSSVIAAGTVKELN